jgi:hypothetical protein
VFDEKIEIAQTPADGLTGSFAIGGSVTDSTKMEEKDEK